MGNSQNTQKDDFEAENFTRQDLSLEEPKDNLLDESNLRDSQGASQKALLTLLRQGQSKVTWEEFLEQGEIQCETVQKSVACFLCGPVYIK